MLAAQGLLKMPSGSPSLGAVQRQIERLGVVQIDTISVVERSQYLVLWSRLGSYNPKHLDSLLSPRRAIMEYWSHAASIVPMVDYPYYRSDMLRPESHLWRWDRAWAEEHPEVVRETLNAVRERGPLASSDFDRDPSRGRTEPWDWHGPKESRRALEVLWITGEVMIAGRRGGQKLYDLRERVLAKAFRGAPPSDEALPSPEERRRHLTLRTLRALGIVTPGWLWDYFRLPAPPNGGKRAGGLALLQGFVDEGLARPVIVEGLDEPAFLDASLPLVAARPRRTTLLSPFDSLIWHRPRARALFDYDVCFEAYVQPHKRRFGYYCLAILHRGRLVGRIDPKMDRAARTLIVRAVHLESGVKVDDGLVVGLVGALLDLAHFLGGDTAVMSADPRGHAGLATALSTVLGTGPAGGESPVTNPDMLGRT
ncbi:MAG: winged helix-turn-helix domain-containing protein, partial [Chloroflexota bacterium]